MSVADDDDDDDAAADDDDAASEIFNGTKQSQTSN